MENTGNASANLLHVSQNPPSLNPNFPQPHVIQNPPALNPNLSAIEIFYPLTPTVEEVDSALTGLFLLNNPSNRNTIIPDPLRISSYHPTTVHQNIMPSIHRDNDNHRQLEITMDECRYLQAKIDEGNPHETAEILSNLQHHLHELMMHRFGNLLIQNILQARSDIISQRQMDIIVCQIIANPPKLAQVCMDSHGTWAAQTMLENIKCPIMTIRVLYAIKNITHVLAKNLNGIDFILHCIKLFRPLCQKVIMNEIAKNCVDIATDKIGCTIFNKCFSDALSSPSALLLLAIEIISNVVILTDDPYGNYVVQCLIVMDLSIANNKMVENLRGNYVRLSKNKYASNVVENLLKFSQHNDVEVIVREIMECDRGFLDVLQDPFGNFVAQTSLKCTQGNLHRELFAKVQSHHQRLRNHIYGKKVLVKACGLQ